MFNLDRQDVLDRAEQKGINKIINPGIDINSSKYAIELSKKFKSIYVAVGLHPNSSVINDGFITDIRHLATNPRVVAIGEIGLDYYRDTNSKKTQREIFELQLELASELSLPVIIHNRQADEDISVILSAWHDDLKKKREKVSKFPGVLHSFSSSIDIAFNIIERNFFIGISGIVTYKNAKNIHKVVEEIPIENIIIETDAPFLPPHPYRGQRNEPQFLILVAEKIAQIKNISIEDIALTTSKNAEKLFMW